MFSLELLHRYDDIPVDTQAGGDRFYETPDGTFPSVTTVLDKVFDKTALNKWRKNIGNDAADAIQRQAQQRGNAIHDMAEGYLLNDSGWSKNHESLNIQSFRQIQPLLDSSVKTVYGVELPIWSKFYRIAGRTDGVVKWNDHNSIIDFKTSLRPIVLKSDKVRKYKLQATIYAMMIEELYGIKIPYSVIIVMIQHEDPEIIRFNNELYREVASEILINFKKC